MIDAELVIDIGTKYITINQLGRGIVLKESTAVLLEGCRGKFRLVKSGKAAIEENNTVKNPNMQLVYPVKGGVVQHEQAFVLMFKDFLNKVVPNRIIFRQPIKVLACVSCGLTNTEKTQIENLLIKAGVKEVIILESPIATAACIDPNSAQFVVDIGASKTEVAIVSSKGIVSGCSLNIGGDTFNQALINQVTDVFRCRLSNIGAEKLKFQIGSFYVNDQVFETLTLEEIGSGNFLEYRITSSNFREAIEPLVMKIIEVMYNLTFQIPANLADEICLNGIVLSGGSSLIAGLKEYISKSMQMKVVMSEDPTNDVVKGGMVFLEHPEKLKSVLNVENLV